MQKIRNTKTVSGALKQEEKAKTTKRSVAMFKQELLCTMCTCTAISILLGASVKKKNPCLGYFSAQWVNGIVAQDSMQNPLI